MEDISRIYNENIKPIGDSITNTMAQFRAQINDIITVIKSDPEIQQYMIKYGIIYLTIFLAMALLYTATTDPTALTSRTYVYAFAIIIPIIFTITYIIPFVNAPTKNWSALMIILLTITFFIVGAYSMSTFSLFTFQISSYIINFILLCILIVALAIFFYIFNNYLKTLPGWLGFISYFIFYIPCLLIQFVQYVRNEFRMTTNPVFILFVIEILFILTYLYLPLLVDFSINRNETILLKGNAFLDIPQTIASSDQFKNTDVDPRKPMGSGDLITYRSSYAISMWIYLNIQPELVSKETTIFDYGNGKPKITYINNPRNDTQKDKYIFYFTDSLNAVTNFELSLPPQKWNNIVFNYTSNVADLFVNGKLVRSFEFTDNRPVYSPMDKMVIGTKNGLIGAISNVRYYSEPLTKGQIVTAYNLLAWKNPPIA